MQDQKAKQAKIWLSSPHMGHAEEKYVQEAFETNWIAPLGPHVNAFEKALTEYTGAAHAAALNSGTAALHLALIMLDVEKDDEVICQSLTFSASANPIVYQGAKPVFIDSERETWNMDPDLLEQAIKSSIAKGKKPKAIIPVHLYGMPARMKDIMGIAEHYDIAVIEDAAEALGSSIDGKFMGTFGKCGILSFNGNKIITTSGGGALITDEKGLVEKARFLATQARDPAPHYQHSEIGYNYRLSNVLAAIGRGQMKVLDSRIEQRRKNFSFYQEQLSDLPGIYFLPEPKGYYANRWLTTILVEPEEAGVSREEIRLALEQENIESRPLWKPMHMQPVFRSYTFWGGGVSESLFEKGLCLPSGSNLSENDLWKVVDKIITLFK